MRMYRLVKAKYIHDLSGMGARIAGGRWNEKGTAVLYAAQNRSLAIVEYLVHVPMAIKPKDLSMATLEVPDSVSQARVAINDLPADWDAYPPPPELAKLGTEWIAANSEQLLFVPSAVVAREYNIMVNPAHPDMRHVKILQPEVYQFDQRLLR